MIERAALRRRCAAVMVDFGVKGFTVRVGRSPGTAWAHCDFGKREIVFHPRLLETDWVFANQIILHEVAHALAGKTAGHSKKWMSVARGMGYRLGVVVPKTAPLPGEHKWAAVCQTGLHSAIRYEKTYEDGERSCKPCWDSGAGDVKVFWDKL